VSTLINVVSLPIMDRILAYIETKLESEMKVHPFIQWLVPSSEETSETAEKKLKSWIPCMVNFIMGFKDMNQSVLCYPETEANIDPLKAAINEHCKEDGNHWPWLLMDLKTLNLNPDTDWVTLIKFLWGSQTVGQRGAIYDFVRIVQKLQNPLLRLCFICTVEIYGHVMLSTTTELANIIEKETGKKLHYFGQTHLRHEEGHFHCSPTAENAKKEAWTRPLSEEDFEVGIGGVDEAIRIINNMFSELHEFALSSSSEKQA